MPPSHIFNVSRDEWKTRKVYLKKKYHSNNKDRMTINVLDESIIWWEKLSAKRWELTSERRVHRYYCIGCFARKCLWNEIHLISLAVPRKMEYTRIVNHSVKHLTRFTPRHRWHHMSDFELNFLHYKSCKHWFITSTIFSYFIPLKNQSL